MRQQSGKGRKGHYVEGIEGKEEVCARRRGGRRSAATSFIGERERKREREE